MIFLGGNREHFQTDFDKIGRPCVLVTNSAEGLQFNNLSSVCSDNRQAARAAIDALVEMGHRQFAVIGGDREVSDTTRLRYEGCMDAFQTHGISFDPDMDYETVRFSYADGYWAARRLMERHRKFTAIFAMSDAMAIGAIRALQDRGRRVPEDVSVMGFDGLTIGEYTVPRLATVCQDVDALAIHSIHMLLDGIASPGVPRHETVPVIVTLRSSAGPAGEN